MVNYYCECCNYSTKIKTQYVRHNSTKKHIKNHEALLIKKAEELEQLAKMQDSCECMYCGKMLKSKYSKQRHEDRSCIMNPDSEKNIKQMEKNGYLENQPAILEKNQVMEIQNKFNQGSSKKSVKNKKHNHNLNMSKSNVVGTELDDIDVANLDENVRDEFRFLLAIKNQLECMVEKQRIQDNLKQSREELNEAISLATKDGLFSNPMKGPSGGFEQSDDETKRLRDSNCVKIIEDAVIRKVLNGLAEEFMDSGGVRKNIEPTEIASCCKKYFPTDEELADITAKVTAAESQAYDMLTQADHDDPYQDSEDDYDYDYDYSLTESEADALKRSLLNSVFSNRNMFKSENGKKKKKRLGDYTIENNCDNDTDEVDYDDDDLYDDDNQITPIINSSNVNTNTRVTINGVDVGDDPMSIPHIKGALMNAFANPFFKENMHYVPIKFFEDDDFRLYFNYKHKMNIELEDLPQLKKDMQWIQQQQQKQNLINAANSAQHCTNTTHNLIYDQATGRYIEDHGELDEKKLKKLMAGGSYLDDSDDDDQEDNK